jgi:hypothetical protein
MHVCSSDSVVCRRELGRCSTVQQTLPMSQVPFLSRWELQWRPTRPFRRSLGGCGGRGARVWIPPNPSSTAAATVVGAAMVADARLTSRSCRSPLDVDSPIVDFPEVFSLPAPRAPLPLPLLSLPVPVSNADSTSSQDRNPDSASGADPSLNSASAPVPAKWAVVTGG